MQPLPNAAEPALARVIERIGQPAFEAALDAFLRRVLVADNLVILAFRPAAAPLALYHAADGPVVFAELERVYLAGAYLLDPFHDLHLRRAPAGVYRLLDIAPDQFQRSRYFTDYYRRTTLHDELTFVSYLSGGVTLNICCGRDAGTPRPFGPAAAETAARIAPLINALAVRHWAGLGQPDAGSTEPRAMGHAATAAHLRAQLQAAQGIRLSPRQAEVALLILRGHSSVAIGLELGLSPQTIKVFRKQLYGRCGISTQAELFALMFPLLTAADPA